MRAASSSVLAANEKRTSYATKHRQVQQAVEDILADSMKQQPADPLRFLIKHLTEIAAANAKAWFFAAGSSHTKTTAEALQELYSSGTISHDTLVWNERLPAWVPYGEALPTILSESNADDAYPVGSSRSPPLTPRLQRRLDTSASSAGLIGGLRELRSPDSANGASSRTPLGVNGTPPARNTGNGAVLGSVSALIGTPSSSSSSTELSRDTVRHGRACCNLPAFYLQTARKALDSSFTSFGSLATDAEQAGEAGDVAAAAAFHWYGVAWPLACLPLDESPTDCMAMASLHRRGGPYAPVLPRLIDMDATLAARTGSALLRAASKGDSAAVDAALQAGGDANAAAANGVTPLMLVCRSKSRVAVRALLKAGASAGLRSRMGCTAIGVAAERGDATAVAALIEGGADVNTVDGAGESPLMLAARLGHASPVPTLVAAKATVDLAGPDGWTSMLRAAQGGHCAVVESLVRARAALDKRNARGHSPLMLAAAQGYTDVVKTLLEAGAAFAFANSQGETALSFALAKGQTAVVNQLRAWQLKLEEEAAALDAAKETIARRLQACLRGKEGRAIAAARRRELEQQRLLDQLRLEAATLKQEVERASRHAATRIQARARGIAARRRTAALLQRRSLEKKEQQIAAERSRAQEALVQAEAAPRHRASVVVQARVRGMQARSAAARKDAMVTGGQTERPLRSRRSSRRSTPL
jgi:ankyrin repeat protein